jgi:hypothetical protein
LYSVDTQFEELRLQRINYAKRMMQDLVSGRISKQLELNREHLSIYIATKFPEVETPDYAVEIIENSLRGDGIVTIKKLDDILNLTADASRDPELEEEGPVFEPLYVIHQIVVATMLYDIRLARLCKSPEENRVIIEKYEGVRRKYGLDKYPEALE